MNGLMHINLPTPKSIAIIKAEEYVLPYFVWQSAVDNRRHWLGEYRDPGQLVGRTELLAFRLAE